jgi:hypothetical protein
MMPENTPPVPPPAVATTSVSPPPPPRPRLRVFPIALLPLLPLIVIEIVFHAPQTRYRSDGQVAPLSEAIGSCIGQIWVILFFAALIAGIVFLLSNRRSWAANVVFALLVLAGCGGSWFSAYATSVTRALEITNRARTLLAWHVQRTASVQQEVADAGSLNVAKFDEPGELEARLALLERLRAALQAAVTAGDGAYSAVPEELARAGVFRGMRERALADFQRDMDWPRKLAAFNASVAMYDAAIALFRHLAETKGTWSVTPGVNNIEFHTPQAKARGDELRDALMRAGQQAITAFGPTPATAPSTAPSPAPTSRD